MKGASGDNASLFPLEDLNRAILVYTMYNGRFIMCWELFLDNARDVTSSSMVLADAHRDTTPNHEIHGGIVLLLSFSAGFGIVHFPLY